MGVISLQRDTINSQAWELWKVAPARLFLYGVTKQKVLKDRAEVHVLSHYCKWRHAKCPHLEDTTVP